MIKNKVLSNILYPLITVVAFVGVWYLVSFIANVPILLPRPDEVLSSFWELLGTQSFYYCVLGTLFRAVCGFAISVIVAVIFAIFSAFSHIAEKILNPVVTVLRSTPTMSLILLVVVWLDSDFAPMFIGSLIVFPIIYSALLSQIKNVDKELVQVCDVYKVGKWQRIKFLYVPSVAPTFFDALSSSVSLNVKVVIAGEVLAQTAKSMGVMMQIAKASIEIDELLAWTVFAIVLSFLLESLVALIKKLFFKIRRIKNV